MHLPSSRSQHNEVAVGGGARHGSVIANPVAPAEGGDIHAALHTHGLPSSQEDQMEAVCSFLCPLTDPSPSHK